MKILNLYAGIGGNRKWARQHSFCIKCGTREVKHKGKGLCIKCFDNLRKKNPNSRIAQAKYRLTHRKEIRESQLRAYHTTKQELYDLLGNKCIRCGFSDRRALQIDHINGGGVKERKTLNIKDYCRVVLKSIKNNENKYQLLCANCNWIKRFENKEL